MSNIVTLSSGLRLHYQSQGEGVPLLCLPGWAYSTEVFARNLPVLAQHYKVICIDPRSHGRSDVTTDGNDYGQHGKDLQEFISALNLTEFSLLGWSLGVYDIYAYLEQFGFEGVRAVVAVDESPRIVQQSDPDWSEGSQAEIDGLIELVDSDAYLGFFRDYMASGFVKPPEDELLDRFTKTASSLTPAVAAGLLKDAAGRDYTGVAAAAAQNVPVLNIVREDWSEAAQRWIGEHQPSASIQVLGNHLMLYEFADEFNNHVLNFLKDA